MYLATNGLGCTTLPWPSTLYSVSTGSSMPSFPASCSTPHSSASLLASQKCVAEAYGHCSGLRTNTVRTLAASEPHEMCHYLTRWRRLHLPHRKKKRIKGIPHPNYTVVLLRPKPHRPPQAYRPTSKPNRSPAPFAAARPSPTPLSNAA